MSYKVTKYKPKNLSKLFLGIIPVLLLVVSFSCENETSSLGEGLLPDGDKIQFHYDTTLSFRGNIFEREAFNTSNREYYSLGVIEDDYFGFLKGEYLGQFLPSKYDTAIFKNDIDSAILFLAVDSVYGDPKNNISFEAYELTSEIDEDSTYLSNTDISDFFNVSDIISNGYSYSGDSAVKISLTSDFITKLTSVEDTLYKDLDLFKSTFKGIAIIPTLTTLPGGTEYVDASSIYSKIVLYYNDSLTYTYKLSTGHRFTKYTIDNSNSVVNDYLTNPETENDDLLFLQGINGVTSKITFSNIKPWIKKDSTYSVMTAELIVPVFKDDLSDVFPPPNRLFLQYYDEDSTLNYIEDFNSGYVDGIYNSSENIFKFNISKHLTRILNEDIADSSIYFNLLNNLSFPSRVILESSENMKLKITYTKH